MFSERLKMLRTEKGLTQGQLAQELGISNKTISVYEKGTSLPTLDTLERLASYFDITIDYLIGYSDHSNPKIDMMAKELNLSPEAVKSIRRLAKEDINIISPLLENNNFIQFLDYAKLYLVYQFAANHNMGQNVLKGFLGDAGNLSAEDRFLIINHAFKTTALDYVAKALDDIPIKIKGSKAD